jgi:hypothetical protein
VKIRRREPIHNLLNGLPCSWNCDRHGTETAAVQAAVPAAVQLNVQAAVQPGA